MNEWRPIEEYDRKKHPLCAFLFAPLLREERPESSLPAIVKTDRLFGSRTCVAFCELPPIEPALATLTPKGGE